jgi:hypothetical protein
MMPDPVIIRLTPAELMLLMRSLKIETLPGLAPDLFAGLDEEQRQEALQVAEQTLRARRFVGWAGNQQRIINPTLANLLLDFAHPRYTLFVDTELPGGKRGIPFLYVFGEQGIYEQSQPEPGVVQFGVIAGRDALMRRLSPRLPEERPAEPERWRGHIKQKLLNGVLRIRDDEKIVFRYLASALPLELAEALAASYHAPQVVQYIASWQAIPTEEHPRPGAALTILQGPEHAFLLWVERPDLGEEAPVYVQLFSAPSLREYIEKVVPSFPID